MENFENLSPLALAFLGDAIHTAFVRCEVLKGEKEKLNTYHTRAKNFCNASAQANALEALENKPNFLTETEKDIVRKARNTHNKHSAKNFDEETYKKATSFEALLGFLYLSNQKKRLEEILQKSVEIQQKSQKKEDENAN